jgi:histidinol-phosphate aminotransferase
MRLNENGFTLNIEQLRLELNDSSVKVFFLCRPNNPTGETLSLKDIEVIAQIAGPNRLLIIDEAYIEFSSQPSATTLIKIYPNIVVLRTFSKAWAMAGARFGVAISSQEASAVLEKVRAPYPISVPVRDMIVAQLNDDGVTAMKNRVQQILVNRAVLEDQLKTLESVDTVFKSDSNYLLVKAPKHARSILAHLRSRGIVLRDWSGHPLLEDCIRITVGSAAENSILLSAWQAWERALYA